MYRNIAVVKKPAVFLPVSLVYLILVPVKGVTQITWFTV